MGTENQVTVCITMGKRPEMLRRCLTSLDEILARHRVLAVNDFLDEETNAVFRSLCPDGELVTPGRHVGQHRAIDAMYARVTTPYIFHCEDDWDFDRQDFLEPAIRLIEANPAIVSVCERKEMQIEFKGEMRGAVQHAEDAGVAYRRCDSAHPQWFGFTFNPHVAPKSLWEELGGFSAYRKERHISRLLRSQGRFVAFADPGTGNHVGIHDSVMTVPAPTRIRRWIRKKTRRRA